MSWVSIHSPITKVSFSHQVFRFVSNSRAPNIDHGPAPLSFDTWNEGTLSICGHSASADAPHFRGRITILIRQLAPGEGPLRRGLALKNPGVSYAFIVVSNFFSDRKPFFQTKSLFGGPPPTHFSGFFDDQLIRRKQRKGKCQIV